MYDGEIIDAHHHLWDLSTGWYRWLTTDRPEEMVFGDPTPLARDYGVADYLADMKPLKLAKSVHIQAALNPDDPVAETRWLQGLADENGFPHGIVAFAPLEDPDVEDILARHCESPNVRGIRQIVSWHRDPRFSFLDRPDLTADPTWRRGFALLSRFNLSFDLMLFPTQLGDALALAHAFPDTQIILNHTGSPVDRDPEGLALWRRGMEALAAAPNVAVKISDLGAYDHDWTLDSIRPFVLSTIEWFGPERCLFATDLPVAALHGSAAAIYDAFSTLVDGFSADEQRRLFHDNAARYYRLG